MKTAAHDDVRFVEVADEQTVADWRHIHNAIIPTDPLSLDEVRERSGIVGTGWSSPTSNRTRSGNSTVRRPTDDAGAR